MAIEVESRGVSGLSYAHQPASEPVGELAMSDEAFVGLAAGALLIAAALSVATGFGAGYLIKRGFFCDGRRI